MTRDELIKELWKFQLEQGSIKSILSAVDAYTSASLREADVMGGLPTLEDAWNAGIDEGGARVGNFEWGIRRKNIDFAEWYAAEIKDLNPS